MKIHDVSLSIRSGMPVWPGDDAVQLHRQAKIEDGANANVSYMGISVHTGTHVDSPYHFLPDGSTVDVLPLDVLVGPVHVFEISEDVDVIDAALVYSLDIPEGTKRILFKTRNSEYWTTHPDRFQTDFVGISENGAIALVEKEIKLVGIDYLSIAPFKKSRPTHEVLLKYKMVVIEGLDLSNIRPGEYDLVCLPLKLKDTDGAPARTILIEKE